jgi:hypothetical protein
MIKPSDGNNLLPEVMSERLDLPGIEPMEQLERRSSTKACADHASKNDRSVLRSHLSISLHPAFVLGKHRGARGSFLYVVRMIAWCRYDSVDDEGFRGSSRTHES